MHDWWKIVVVWCAVICCLGVEGYVTVVERSCWMRTNNPKIPFITTTTTASLHIENTIALYFKRSSYRSSSVSWIRMVKDENDESCDDGEIILPNIESTSAAAAADMDDNTVLGEIYDTGGVLLQDLSWRVEKLRLEEQNIQRFLKARPRFLPYNECRKWVQAFNRWQTEDDWNEWIAMGEKRNAYIPSRPAEYYGRLGQWVSWDHFLLGSKKKHNMNSNSGSSSSNDNSSLPVLPRKTAMDCDVDNEFR